MPSASEKQEKQGLDGPCDPMQNAVTILEKRVRNLEKRRVKLDAYKLDSQNGKELNEDQKKAIEKYDQVVEVLEFAKELHKQFHTMLQESIKTRRKAAQNEILEKQQKELQKIKNLIIYQDILNCMGDEVSRKDFLDGSNGAIKLTEYQLNNLDELYKAICPERDPNADDDSKYEEQLSTAAGHVQALLNSKKKSAFGTTYKSLKDTLTKIKACNYFYKSPVVETDEAKCDSNQTPAEENTPENALPEELPESPLEANNPVEQSLMAQQSGMPSSQADRPYYQIESSSLYTEQTHPIQPIQEVLSMQGNLNFLQESQIEIEANCVNSSAPVVHPVATYANMQYTTHAGSIPPPHRPVQRLNQEIPSSNAIMTNSSSVAHPVPSSMPSQVHMTATNLVQPVAAPVADFDPARPIPTQMFTNQRIHPMMSAAAVTQNYAPVTIPHGISAPHALQSNVTMKHMVQPSAQQFEESMKQSVVANPNPLSLAVHEQAAGMTAPATLPQVSMHSHNQQRNVQHHMNLIRDNSQAVHPSNIPAQFERSDIKAYQSTNNNQAYLNRESFASDSSYSNNVKRGLNARGGARGGNGAHAANSNFRGSRGGYRN